LARFPGPGLSAIRAAAARDGLEGLYLFAGVRILDQVADVDDALEADVRVVLIRFGGARVR
jgi:hypothetical protein